MTPTPGPWAYDGVRVYEAADRSGRSIALVYVQPADDTKDANGHMLASAPTLLEALHAVWRLVETLDIGTAEKAAIRDLIYPAIDEARGPYPRVIDTDPGPLTAAEKDGPLALRFRAALANRFAASSEMLNVLKAASHALKSYQHGNASTDLAREISAAADAVIAKAEGRAPVVTP